MEKNARSFGSAIHLRLMSMPLLLFLGALLADIVYSLSQNPLFAAIAFIFVSAGIPVGLLDTLFGLLHGSALPAGTRRRQTAWFYGVLNLLLMLLFTFSWFF